MNGKKEIKDKVVTWVEGSRSITAVRKLKIKGVRTNNESSENKNKRSI